MGEVAASCMQHDGGELFGVFGGDQGKSGGALEWSKAKLTVTIAEHDPIDEFVAEATDAVVENDPAWRQWG